MFDHSHCQNIHSQKVRLLEGGGVEKLFGQRPFEQCFSCAGASLSLSAFQLAHLGACELVFLWSFGTSPALLEAELAPFKDWAKLSSSSSFDHPPSEYHVWTFRSIAEVRICKMIWTRQNRGNHIKRSLFSSCLGLWCLFLLFSGQSEDAPRSDHHLWFSSSSSPLSSSPGRALW